MAQEVETFAFREYGVKERDESDLGAVWTHCCEDREASKDMAASLRRSEPAEALLICSKMRRSDLRRRSEACVATSRRAGREVRTWML